jgi:hypothetical protein
MKFNQFLNYCPICPICKANRTITSIFSISMLTNKAISKLIKSPYIEGKINYRLQNETINYQQETHQILLSKYNYKSITSSVSTYELADELLFQYLPDYIHMNEKGEIDIPTNKKINIKGMRITLGCKDHYFYYGILDFPAPKLNTIHIEIECLIAGEYKILNDYRNYTSTVSINKNTYPILLLPITSYPPNVHEICTKIENLI